MCLGSEGIVNGWHAPHHGGSDQVWIASWEDITDSRLHQDLESLQTSMCNKSYLQLYPAATATATAIVNIIQGGAFIVGKTKLSSFLSREEATESIDFQTAWNPRADGYQTPGGSSSGSAAAVAAYDWIDIGIGTDTNGSIRRPAQCNGVFGKQESFSSGAASCQ